MSITRIGSLPLQDSLAQAIQRVGAALARTQAELGSGRRAVDFAALGSDGVRSLSAHNLLARAGAQAAGLKSVAGTLATQDAQLDRLADDTAQLRADVLRALGTGDATGLDARLDQAYEGLAATLNAGEGGRYLFAGSRTDTPPFAARSRAELGPGDLFAGDDVLETRPLGDGRTMTVGIAADRIGAGLAEAFRALGTAPTAPLDAAVRDRLTAFVGTLDAALPALREVHAGVGRNQTELERVEDRLAGRSIVLRGVIGAIEDADLAEVATRMAAEQTALEASYAAFASLRDLSLVRFL